MRKSISLKKLLITLTALLFSINTSATAQEQKPVSVYAGIGYQAIEENPFLKSGFHGTATLGFKLPEDKRVEALGLTLYEIGGSISYIDFRKKISGPGGVNIINLFASGKYGILGEDEKRKLPLYLSTGIGISFQSLGSVDEKEFYLDFGIGAEMSLNHFSTLFIQGTVVISPILESYYYPLSIGIKF